MADKSKQVWARVMWFWRKEDFHEEAFGMKFTNEQYGALYVIFGLL